MHLSLIAHTIQELTKLHFAVLARKGQQNDAVISLLILSMPLSIALYF